MNKENILQAIDAYFGAVPHKAELRCGEHTVYASVSYRDFKPEVEVVKDLISILPMCEFTLDRTYSRQVVMDALWEIYREDEELARRVDSILWLHGFA